MALLSDDQSAGRGRLGRRWHNDAPAAVAGSGTSPVQAMLGSIPQVWAIGERGVSLVPFAAGMAVLDVVAASVGPRIAPSIGLGWPNDVLVSRNGRWRKLAGILVETAPVTSPVTPSQPAVGVVIGVGLNLGPVHRDADPEVVHRAISLAELVEDDAGSIPPNVELFTALLKRLPVWTDRLRTDPLAFMRDYRGRCSTLFREVTVQLGDGPFVGVAQEVTDEGELVVHRGGLRRVISAGDVVLSPETS